MNASATRRLRMIFLLLCTLPAFGQSNARPFVNVEHVDPLFKVYASVVLPVTPCIAYRLLTDYNSLPGYIPGMLQIRARRLSENRVDIWQEGEVEVLFFRVRLVASLEMEETPERRIVFRQTAGDLASYSGEWNILKTGGGTIVTYSAAITLKPEQLIPAFLAKSVLENEVGRRFEAIAKEAPRRGNKAVPECVSDK